MTFGHMFMITLARIDGTILSRIVSWGCANHYREDVCVGPGESASAKRGKNQRGLRGEAGRKGRQSAFMFVCVYICMCDTGCSRNRVPGILLKSVKRLSAAT